MRETPIFCFAPFRLDPGAERLWRGEVAIRLTAKAFAVLRYLVEHAGQLVTKDALFDAVWASAAVSEAALTVCIGEIRRALADAAQHPQFLETVRGRGYRFIAPVTLATPNVSPPLMPALPPTLLPPGPPSLLVEREDELLRLQQCWVQAQQGVRQIVFVRGEVGIGKTTLVDTFVSHVAATAPVWYGRGQCIEQYGAGEAYLPLFEILGQMRQGPYEARLVEVCIQYAPTWLLQMPALLPETVLETLLRRASGATQQRMLRELAEAIEILAADKPLLLVLEDLHWSDISTLDWLTYVAQRRQAARLLVVGTYRPTDALMREHPVYAVTRDLVLHGHGVEIELGYLSPAGVAAYLAQRCAGVAPPEPLVQALYQRTDGHPFFLVTVVDELVQQGGLGPRSMAREQTSSLEMIARDMPASIRQGITQQVERCTPEVQTVLEAASVVGTEFTAVAVAAGLEQTVDAVEALCDTCARRAQFLQALDPTDWPDGTVTACYRFRHDLYREVLYERVPGSRRIRWHRQIGVRLEAGYGPQARDMAAELAEHFVRGHDTTRAVQYLQIAATQALQRSAYQEALRHCQRGLELLAILPETAEQTQQELDLRMTLGPALMATKGQAVPEVEQNYARARVLCAQIGEPSQLMSTLGGLCRFYRNWGALPTAWVLAEQLDELAQRTTASALRLIAHDECGSTLFYMGEFAVARPHLEKGIALIDPTAQRPLAFHHDVVPGIRCLSFAAYTLWCLGYPSQAVQRCQEALAQAQAFAHPYSLATAQAHAAYLYHRLREISMLQAEAASLLTLASTQGFPLWIGTGTCLRGWVLVMQGQHEAGMAQLRQGMTTVLSLTQPLAQPRCLLLLAEAAGHIGQVDEGLRLLTKALAVCKASGQGDILPEAYRLQGILLLLQALPDATRAESCLHRALTIARQQQARSWELRAAMSLARLWQHQGKRAAARDLLAPIYGWFTEGFDTADLQDARTLLEELT